jgi:RND family efflux transporter MFP subunit
MPTSVQHKLKLYFFYLLSCVIFLTPFTASSEESTTQQDTSSAIQLATTQYQNVEQVRLLDALVEAVHKATMSAQTSGRVSEIYYDVNDYVKKGAVLMRMRDKDQQAKLNAAKAKFKQAETEFNRVQELFIQKLMAKSNVDRAESQFKSSLARLDQEQENLERTVIRAPYSGIVVKRHIEVGETARPGMPLFTGLSLETLRVAVNLPQDIISAVRQHKSARVLLLGDENKSIAAKSMTISPYADADSHTFLVRVNLPAGDHGLYPGMAVKVAFATGTIRKLQVPVTAVTHRSEVTGVYVMNENKKLTLRQIQAGHRLNNGMIEVLSGLSENERVATDPVKAASYLKEQMHTNIN